MNLSQHPMRISFEAQIVILSLILKDAECPEQYCRYLDIESLDLEKYDAHELEMIRDELCEVVLQLVLYVPTSSYGRVLAETVNVQQVLPL